MPSLFAELKRRNVLRAGVLYIGAMWALAQGISQLGPAFNAPEWFTRWFVIAAMVGFPFAILFSWFYEFTPQGLKRESEVVTDDSIALGMGRKLDFAIIGVLAVAVVLLVTDRFVSHRESNAAAPGKSIAVLPFANDSGNKDEQYLSDGLSESLIIALSQFAGLKIISRDSSFQFRDSKDDAKTIGAKLGVAHLLEGSVRRVDGEVRISTMLVNVADGSMLWSQRYDRPYKDLFALQDEIANTIAGELQTKLQPGASAASQDLRPPSGSLDAYNAWLQGNFHETLATEADLRKSIADYDRAIELDPQYALAYAARSRVRSILAEAYLGGGDSTEMYARARSDAQQAQALAPDLGNGYLAMGAVLLLGDMNLAAAEAEYRKAVALTLPQGAAMPKRYLGNVLAQLGRLDEAVRLMHESVQLDPLSVHAFQNLSEYELARGEPDAAEQAIRKAILLRPDAAFNYLDLAVIDIVRGDPDSALRNARQETDDAWRDVAVTLALQIGADRAMADSALRDLIAHRADAFSFQIAEVYALRKEPDTAFVWLDRAWAARDSGVMDLLLDPFFRALQDDPRFAAFCKKVGLPVPGENTKVNIPPNAVDSWSDPQQCRPCNASRDPSFFLRRVTASATKPDRVVHRTN